MTQPHTAPVPPQADCVASPKQSPGQLTLLACSLVSPWDHVTETRWDNGVPKVATIQWTYDAASRLTNEVISSADPGVTQTEHFVYDLAGNRLTFTKDVANNGTIDETDTSTYDANDRLLIMATQLLAGTNTNTTYVYGGAGNPATMLTSKSVNDTAGNLLQQVTYTYNLQGYLGQAVTTSYSAGYAVRRETATFQYDDSGIRTQATDLLEVAATPGAPLLVQSQTTTTYLNDAHNATGYAQVVDEITRDVATGNETKRVVSVTGLDVISQTTFTLGGPGAGITRVLDYDGHGSTRLLTDLTTAVLQVYAYDAFGNALGFDPAAALTNLLYSGQQWDPRVGLQYLRARYYDPASGRFTSLDQDGGNLQDPQSLHKYLYTHGDPITGVDPSGRFLGAVFFALGNLTASLWALFMGGITLLMLNTFGKTGFMLREAGLTLIADGDDEDFDFGFFVYNVGSQVVELTLQTIEAVDTAIGLGQLLGVAIHAGVALVRHAPEIADTVIGAGQRLYRDIGTHGIYHGVIKPCGSWLRWTLCFTPDTPVATRSGVRAIREINAGDQILAFDFKNDEWRVRTVAGRQDSIYDGPLVTIETGASTIQTTVYHPFWVVDGRDLDERTVPRELEPGEDEGHALAGRWVNSHELRAGDMIFTRDGTRQIIKRIEQRYDGPKPVCNLSIEDDHTFAVGNDGMLVHNVSVCEVLAKKKSLDLTTLLAVAKREGKQIHAHHMVPKVGVGDHQQKAVKKAAAILKKGGIENHIEDPRNITPAIHWDHSDEYVDSVLARLEKAAADAEARRGNIVDNVQKALDEIEEKLNRGIKYRYP